MIRRRTAIGLTVFCALLVSAFAVQSASAKTWFTCKAKSPAGGAGFSAAHCKPSDAVPSGATFEHKSFVNGTVTDATFSDRNTAGTHTGAILKSTVAGSAVELVATEVSGSGTNSNSEEGGEMIGSAEGTLVYSGVTEKLLGCTVTGKPGGAGVVETKQLFATTKGAGENLKFTPKEGTLFAEFELTGCAVGPTTVKVVGSVLAAPDGSTFNTVHNTVTAAGTLHLGSAFGPVAGIAGTLTIIAKDTAAGDTSYTPVGLT